MARRTPPKQRHHDRPPRTPSHNAGSFDESGYGSGHGPFGFTQHVLP